MYTYNIDRTYVKGLFRFGHSNGVQPLQTLLGFYYQDDPPTYENYKEQQLTRVWRSERNMPMAESVTFALYSCDTEAEWTNSPPSGVEWPEKLSPFMIQLLMKELPQKFQVCDTHLCDYEYVKDQYDRYISGCNFHEMCAQE